MNKKLKETRRNAKRIIQKAKETQMKLLKESELLRLIQIEGDNIRESVKKECLEMKRKAKEEIAKMSNENV